MNFAIGCWGPEERRDLDDDDAKMSQRQREEGQFGRLVSLSTLVGDASFLPFENSPVSTPPRSASLACYGWWYNIMYHKRQKQEELSNYLLKA